MTDVGTLKELNVKPGDVVEVVKGPYRLSDYAGVEWKVFERHPLGYCDVPCAYYDRGYLDNGYMPANDCSWTFRIISRASDKPKLWEDMTPEEKCALLLAKHEGKVIEWTGHLGDKFFMDSLRGTPVWCGTHAYRIRPEQKIEIMTLYWQENEAATAFMCSDDTHRITFNMIDGKPDCDSVKMEPLV